jgi:signal transduction histidine kinase
VVGAAQTIAEILESRGSSSQPRFHLFPILTASDGLLLAAESEDPGFSPSSCQPSPLRHLELKLLHAYFRLHAIERRLSRQAARRRRGGGLSALRQIELERRRLGSELHTGVGQMLAAIRLQLEVVTSQVCDPPAPVRQALDNIAALAAQALDQVRSISRRLHPPEWQRLTIEDALHQLWNLSGIPLIFDAHLSLEALDSEPDPEVKSLIYRTAQEGLSNIIGHSKASRVAMSLHSRGDLLMLALEDDGVGFDPDRLARTPRVGGGIGLRSITEQAEALGAKIDIESGRNGTKLFLSTQFSVNPEL